MRRALNALSLTIVLLAGSLPAFAQTMESPDSRTSFRGLSLGQTRPQVEAVLGELGWRCMSEAEKDDLQGFAYVERMGEWDVCRIVPTTFGAHDYELERYLWDVVAPEATSGSLRFAVRFNNGRANYLYLMPEFFNAAHMTPHGFAEALVANYPIAGGLQPTRYGWLGTTSTGEAVEVQVSADYSTFKVVIAGADDVQLPAFDSLKRSASPSSSNGTSTPSQTPPSADAVWDTRFICLYGSMEGEPANDSERVEACDTLGRLEGEALEIGFCWNQMAGEYRPCDS